MCVNLLAALNYRREMIPISGPSHEGTLYSPSWVTLQTLQNDGHEYVGLDFKCSSLTLDANLMSPLETSISLNATFSNLFAQRR